MTPDLQQQILTASTDLQAAVVRMLEARHELDDARKLVGQCEKQLQEAEKAVKAAELVLRDTATGGQDRYVTYSNRVREM